MLGLWSCVGKGEIRHDERLAIDMKFSPAAAFLIGFSQRSFVWEMTGGSLRRLTPSGADVNFKLRCAAPVLSLCSRTEPLHLAGLPVSWFSVNPTRSSSANTRPSQQADGRQAEEVEQPRRRRRGRRARGRRRRSSCRAYGVGPRSTATRFPAQPVPAQLISDSFNTSSM